MITFAKAQAASLIASAADYIVTIFLVEVVGFWYLAGSCTGTVVGGIINFAIGRRWVFKKGVKARHIQFMRYALVWGGYLLLTMAGVFVLTHYTNINYLVSKTVVSLLLAFGYNYPLQKKFVFR